MYMYLSLKETQSTANTLYDALFKHVYVKVHYTEVNMLGRHLNNNVLYTLQSIFG